MNSTKWQCSIKLDVIHCLEAQEVRYLDSVCCPVFLQLVSDVYKLSEQASSNRGGMLVNSKIDELG